MRGDSPLSSHSDPHRGMVSQYRSFQNRSFFPFPIVGAPALQNTALSATDKNQKGVWQVTPTKHDWDHVDFVGQDSTDTKRTRDELQQFWHGLADDLVQSEIFGEKFETLISYMRTKIASCVVFDTFNSRWYF